GIVSQGSSSKTAGYRIEDCGSVEPRILEIARNDNEPIRPYGVWPKSGLSLSSNRLRGSSGYGHSRQPCTFFLVELHNQIVTKRLKRNVNARPKLSYLPHARRHPP